MFLNSIDLNIVNRKALPRLPVSVAQGLLTSSLVDIQYFLVYHMHHIRDSSLFFLQCTLWKVSASLFAALPATRH